MASSSRRGRRRISGKGKPETEARVERP